METERPTNTNYYSNLFKDFISFITYKPLFRNNCQLLPDGVLYYLKTMHGLDFSSAEDSRDVFEIYRGTTYPRVFIKYKKSEFHDGDAIVKIGEFINMGWTTSFAAFNLKFFDGVKTEELITTIFETFLYMILTERGLGQDQFNSAITREDYYVTAAQVLTLAALVTLGHIRYDDSELNDVNVHALIEKLAHKAFFGYGYKIKVGGSHYIIPENKLAEFVEDYDNFPAQLDNMNVFKYMECKEDPFGALIAGVELNFPKKRMTEDKEAWEVSDDSAVDKMVENLQKAEKKEDTNEGV